MEGSRLPLQPANQDGSQFKLSVAVWNQLRGLDWNGLEYMIEIYGILDVEELIFDLTTIRDHQSDGK